MTGAARSIQSPAFSHLLQVRVLWMLSGLSVEKLQLLTFHRAKPLLKNYRNTYFARSMSRRPHSTSPPDSPRLSKKPKLDHLTSEDFKKGVFLAPMVRSGACA